MLTKGEARKQEHERRMAEYKVTYENIAALSHAADQLEQGLSELFTRCPACYGTGMNGYFADHYGDLQEYVCWACFGGGGLTGEATRHPDVYQALLEEEFKDDVR